MYITALFKSRYYGLCCLKTPLLISIIKATALKLCTDSLLLCLHVFYACACTFNPAFCRQSRFIGETAVGSGCFWNKDSCSPTACVLVAAGRRCGAAEPPRRLPGEFPALVFEAANVAQLCCFSGNAQPPSNNGS